MSGCPPQVRLIIPLCPSSATSLLSQAPLSVILNLYTRCSLTSLQILKLPSALQSPHSPSPKPPSLHLISSSATHRYTGTDLLFPCQFIKVAMCLMPLSSSHLYLYLTCSCFVPVSCSGFTCILICRLFTRLAAVPLWMTLPLQTPFLMSTHACLTVLRAFRGHFRRYVFELSACFRLLLVQSLFAFTCSETVAVLSRRRCDDFAAFVNDDHSITS